MEVIVLVGIEETPQMQVAGDDHHEWIKVVCFVLVDGSKS